jgi:hypothetical protein
LGNRENYRFLFLLTRGRLVATNPRSSPVSFVTPKLVSVFPKLLLVLPKLLLVPPKLLPVLPNGWKPSEVCPLFPKFPKLAELSDVEENAKFPLLDVEGNVDPLEGFELSLFPILPNVEELVKEKPLLVEDGEELLLNVELQEEPVENCDVSVDPEEKRTSDDGVLVGNELDEDEPNEDEDLNMKGVSLAEVFDLDSSSEPQDVLVVFFPSVSESLSF